MDPRTVLYYASALAGIAMLLGGMILVSRGKILIDKETKEVIDIELPVLGRLKTNLPRLVFFLMGLVLVLYPVMQARNMNPMVPVHGEAEAMTGQVMVYVAFGPAIIEKEVSDFSLDVPFEASTPYHVLFVANSQVISHQGITPVSPGKTVQVGKKVEYQ
ncbi:MAG: hypothetical protein ACHQNV_07180 [Vicinamibacteria bacterium]